jgi:hypothetical protein
VLPAQIFMAEAAGLPLLVSGLTDGLLTKLAVCQVAAAFGCAGPAALNGSQFADESALFPTKADVELGGTVHLPAERGIGVRPDEEALLGLLAYEEEVWIEEERGISVGEVDPAGGFWSLDLSFRLKNVRYRPLIFRGTPN